MENKPDTKTYDKYNFIVAYVEEGRLEVEETSRYLEVKKGMHIGTQLESVEENLWNDYEDETGGYDTGGHGFLFEYIYKGCERIVEEGASNEPYTSQFPPIRNNVYTMNHRRVEEVV